MSTLELDSVRTFAVCCCNDAAGTGASRANPLQGPAPQGLRQQCVLQTQVNAPTLQLRRKLATCCCNGAAGTGASRGTPPAGPSAPGDRSQQRSQQQADTLSNLTAQAAASPAASADVGELRQTIAGLQLQNSQLLYLTKQQQATIADLEVWQHKPGLCSSLHVWAVSMHR